MTFSCAHYYETTPRRPPPSTYLQGFPAVIRGAARSLDAPSPHRTSRFPRVENSTSSAWSVHCVLCGCNKIHLRVLRDRCAYSRHSPPRSGRRCCPQAEGTASSGACVNLLFAFGISVDTPPVLDDASSNCCRRTVWRGTCRWARTASTGPIPHSILAISKTRCWESHRGVIVR